MLSSQGNYYEGEGAGWIIDAKEGTENIRLDLYMFLKWLSGHLIADITIRWAEGPLHKSYN
jgi:hypothetical protein